MAQILVVEDEDSVRRTVIATLKSVGHQVLEAANAERALQILTTQTADLILTDLRLPKANGLQLLRNVKLQQLPCEVIIMTGYATVDSAVKAMQEGAADYITKPFNPGELTVRIERVLHQSQLQRKVQNLERTLHERFHPENIIAVSPSMRQILQQLYNIAPTDSSVLITGESGTGKELIATALHLLSPRAEKPFIAVNCGALPENLLESELFGHMKGAFTGATATQQGLIEAADGGSLMLDEIGDASLSVQVKLLRVLETNTMRRVGDTKERKVNIRLIAATNKDLSEEMAQGRFRQDLYYRINVIPIHIPTLRERPEDIQLLAKFFLQRHTSRLKKEIKQIDEAVLNTFVRYPWPGNVRELENVVEYAVAMADSERLQVKDLPMNFRPEHLAQSVASWERSEAGKILPLAELEKRHILRTLESLNWHQRQTCKLLQISKVTLYRRLKEYGIIPPTRKT